MKTCAKCDRPADRENGRRGLCWSHYWEWRVSRDPATVVRRAPAVPCGAEGCDRDARTKGFCDGHYRRWRKHGDPLAPDRRVRTVKAERAPAAPRRILTDDHFEDVEWMAETGESMDGAAARLGVTPRALEKFLERRDRLDLRAVLVARNPVSVPLRMEGAA